MKILKKIIVLFLLIFNTTLFAQITKKINAGNEFTIKGIITDKNTSETLIGVNVFVEGEKIKGTISDFEGNYELKVNAGDILIFKYVGYKDKAITIVGNETQNVILEEETVELNTVVVSASKSKEKILDAPASISVVDADAIKRKSVVNISDHIKNVSGVHIMKSGIQGGSPSVRGFNGYYTSDLMTLVDNRVAKMPNTGINSFQFISTVDDDIDRIEVLKGPSAALYGPNASNGVVHLITKSPIDNQETKISTTFGVRSMVKDTIRTRDKTTPRFDDSAFVKRGIFSVSFRHSDTVFVKNPNVKVGYKFSAKYFRARDWLYDDLGDPANVTKFIAGKDSVSYLLSTGKVDPKGKGDLVKNERNEKIENGYFDSRIDVRVKEDLNIILSGGYTITKGIQMTPVGALQAKNWSYHYAQARIIWKDLFIQTYMNGNNSGKETYFTSVGGFFRDKSSIYSLQVQHQIDPIKKIKLTYGFDAFWNRPNTSSTFHGKNEDKDNIDEYGIYFQGDYKFNPRMQLIVASRFDYNTIIKKPQISPKIALAYKPGTGQNLRITFNRAFKTPGAAGFFVDVTQGEIPNGIYVRNEGTPKNGMHFSYANNPNYNNQILPQFRTPYNIDKNAYFNVGDGSINNAAWKGVTSAIKSQFLTQFGLDASGPLAGLADLLINALAPQTIPSSISHEVRNLNTTTRLFETADNWQKTKDIKGLVPSLNYTYEIGYKGLLAKILGISIDVYKTDFKNYIAPVALLTPTVGFNTTELMNYISPIILNNYNSPSNGLIKLALDGLLDKNIKFNGNSNGNGSDELILLLAKAIDNLPFGVITPQETNGPNMLFVTRNVGDVTLYGADVSVTAYLSKHIVLSTNYSFVNKDSFKVEDAPRGYIALNAPKHKVNVGLNYNIEKIGLNLGTRFQWNAGYPVNTGNFIGTMQPTHDMDIDISWTPTFLNKHFNSTISVQNIYHKEQQYIIGSPYFGTTAMLKMSYTL